MLSSDDHWRLLHQILFNEVPRVEDRFDEVLDLKKMEEYLTEQSTMFFKMCSQKAVMTLFVAQGLALTNHELPLSLTTRSILIGFNNFKEMFLELLKDQSSVAQTFLSNLH